MECLPCNKKFTGPESYQQHLESEKHRKKLNIQEIHKDSSEDLDNSIPSSSKLHEPTKCYVCDLSFDSFGNFQKHSFSPEHALKIMLRQTNSKETPNPHCANNNQQFVTNECKVESTTEERILPELNYKSSSFSYFRNCEVCSKMFSGPESYKQHIESQTHLKKASQQNATSVGGNLTSLKCESCNKCFSGQVPFIQHMSGETHKRKLQNIQFAEKYLSSIDSSHSKAEEQTQQNATSVGGNLTSLKCESCNKCFSGQVPFIQHMSSETHKRKLQNIQFAEKYLSGIDSSYSKAEENEMVVQKENDDKPWFCNICNIQCSGLIPYQQHLEGITHLKKSQRAENETNSIQINGNISTMQVSNFNEVKISEKTENMFKVEIDTYQKDNMISKNDFLLPEQNHKFNIISNDELSRVITIISPEEKINFDEMFNSKDSANKQPDGMECDEFGQPKVSENTQFDSIKEGENGFAIGLSKTDECIEKEAYQTCELCNVSLIDKESAKEHFESKEHIEKKWGIKV